jgi:hypothetical protein
VDSLPSADSLRPARLALAAVSALATLDVAGFIAWQPRTALANPGRAFGSLLGLAIWLTLTVLAAGWTGRERGSGYRGAILGLAGLACAGSVGLMLVHIAAGVSGPLTVGAGIAGIAAAGLAGLAWAEAR